MSFLILYPIEGKAVARYKMAIALHSSHTAAAKLQYTDFVNHLQLIYQNNEQENTLYLITFGQQNCLSSFYRQ